jgi:hypothetical protein
VAIDLYRPPARLGPRYPLYAKLVAIWVIVLIVDYSLLLLLDANPVFGLVIILLPITLVLAIVGSYAAYRFMPDRSVFAPTLRALGFRRGDTEESVRLSDPQEREAARRLRRGAITRREYERIMVRRRFVHGEITQARYNEIVRQLGDGKPPTRGGTIPPGGTS